MDEYIDSGRHIIDKFLSENPELRFVFDFAVDLDSEPILCRQFFSYYIVITVKTLSRLSCHQSSPISNKATVLLHRILEFIDRCERFKDEHNYLNGNCASEAFSDMFYNVGEERNTIVPLLPQVLYEMIADIEERAGIPDIDQEIMEDFRSLENQLEQYVIGGSPHEEA